MASSSSKEESIASTILAGRLTHLAAFGLLAPCADPTRPQKGIHSLTEMAIELMPLLVHVAACGRRHT